MRKVKNLFFFFFFFFNLRQLVPTWLYTHQHCGPLCPFFFFLCLVLFRCHNLLCALLYCGQECGGSGRAVSDSRHLRHHPSGGHLLPRQEQGQDPGEEEH